MCDGDFFATAKSEFFTVRDKGGYHISGKGYFFL
jgi:hypothetical protein